MPVTLQHHHAGGCEHRDILKENTTLQLDSNPKQTATATVRFRTKNNFTPNFRFSFLK